MGVRGGASSKYFCIWILVIKFIDHDLQLSPDKVEVPILCERQWKPKKEGDKENRTESSHREEEEADVFQVLRSKKVPEAIRIMGVDDSR